MKTRIISVIQKHYGMFAFAVFLLGITSHWLYSVLSAPTPVTESGLRENGKYAYIAPLLLCNTSQNTNSGVYKGLRSSITDEIQGQIALGNVDSVSVYFRDFKKAQWLGIDENAPYSPASLLKVPDMIAYFKEAEENPDILSKQVRYDGTFDFNSSESYKPAQTITPGMHTIGDLIEAMIKYSDNNATYLLGKNLDPKVQADVYSDLGLSIPPINSPAENLISAKQYSYFFRVLYNATYLSPELSEKALEILTHTTFTQGISAPLPKDIPVAQKFGERTVLSTAGIVEDRELHDCGIIYAPNHPYLLCVMTRGKDFSDLSGVIQKISSIVYADINK